jgi:hypothetical protein
MSTIAERLARDIEAVTGGVVVTESELKEARDVLEGRIDSRRKHDRRRILAVAGAAAIVIPVVGFIAFQTLGDDDKSAPPVNPAPTTRADPYEDFLTGRAPTPDLLKGVWRVDNGTTLLRFSPPNRIALDDRGRLFADPGAEGTYVISGHLITVTVDGGPAGCAGQEFAMRASLPERGAMRFVHTRPGTGRCSPEFVEVTDHPSSYDDVSWGLEQVLPTRSEFLASLDNSNARNWTALANRDAVVGDWMAEGGGHMLELSQRGAYSVADESGDLVDRGQWSLRGRTLTLTSSATSPACAEGDRLVLGGLESVNPGTIVMRGTVEHNGCRGEWTPERWIMIPQG